MNSSEPDSPAGNSDQNEEQLVESLQAGEESAYEAVVRRFGPRMLMVARRFLQHDQDAQDAVQDAFLSAFKAIDQFEGQAKLSTWLHRITVNAALMKIRRRRRKPEQPIDDLLPKFHPDGHLASAIENWAVTTDKAAESRELREQVRKYIDQLPESYRTVLLLRDIEELSTDEAAKLLGITPGAVKTRLHRARQALRELMHPHMTETTA